MARETKTNTGALNVEAMYQAGAAGAVAKKSKTDDDGGFIKQLGRFALSYYMKSIDNLKAARKDESAIFATLDLAALDSDLTIEGVEKIKDKLTKSNTVLNSAKWSLFPKHEKYREAEQNRTEALTSITNLKKQFDAYPVLFEQQTALANKTAVGKNSDGNQVAIGFSTGSTALQMYNSSMLVNGQLMNSMDTDENGNIVVNITDMDGPYRVTAHGEDYGKSTWDNPATEKVETKEDIYGDVRQIKLDDMEFATAENASQTNIANDFISGMGNHGGSGNVMSPERKRDSKIEITGALRDLSPIALVDYLFKKDQWIDDDGGTMSVIEAQIRETIDGAGVEFLEGLPEDEIAEILEDDQIDADEMYGIQELVKYNIKQGGYSVNAIADMIHRKGVKAHEREFKLYKRNNRKEKSVWKQNEEASYNFADKIKSGNPISMGTNPRTNTEWRLIYKPTDDWGTKSIQPKGWFYQTKNEDGRWNHPMYADHETTKSGVMHETIQQDGTTTRRELSIVTPVYNDHDAMIADYYNKYEWHKYNTIDYYQE